MKWDFRHHLLTQIEMLRGGISHEQFSKRLGDVTERCLARYVSGKSRLQEYEFKLIARALSIDAQVLAQAWASSLSLRISGTDAVSQMVCRAYRRWQQDSQIAERSVPSSPSPMAVIRARYPDRLPRQTSPLWFGSYSRSENRKDTPANRARFARAYEMLVESVHGGRWILGLCAVSAASGRGN
jgi:hypothetical protein